MGWKINDLWKGTQTYLTGKQGYLPNWKLKGKGAAEIFSAEGYMAGGEWYRKAATSRISSFGEGLLGKKGAGYVSGEQGWLPE